MSSRLIVTTSLTTALLLTAPAQAGITENGDELNGLSFNGLSFNGLSFNGLSFNGLSFNGLSFNGLSFNGGLLTGVVGSSSVDATDLVGGEFRGYTTDGTPILLRFEDVQQSTEPGNADVYHYTVSYGVETTTKQCSTTYVRDRYSKTGYSKRTSCTLVTSVAWYPICADGGAALAIPGEWLDCQGPGCGGRASADAFTFACRGSSMAKCAEDLGYKPWVDANACATSSAKYCDPMYLADHHEACVRMLRGDYCGNGVAATVNGTQIDVWDDLANNIQVPAGADWGFEAGWAPTGATCVSDVRWNQPIPDAVASQYGLASGATVQDYVSAVCEDEFYTQSFDAAGCWGPNGNMPLNAPEEDNEFFLANTSSTIAPPPPPPPPPPPSTCTSKTAC